MVPGYKSSNRVFRVLTFASVLGLLLAFVPIAAPAVTFPKTLARVDDLGSVSGSAPRTVESDFPVDYLGISWVSGTAPSVRFREDGHWSHWQSVQEDDIPVVGGRTFSTLIPAGDADGFQIRGDTNRVKATSINTTDGPRTITTDAPRSASAAVVQPPVISRSGWGADESLRFNADGTEKWPPAFYKTEKLIVHHTDTQNDDPDPAATVRAIYRYHAIDKGWGDIGYNFLVDAQGRIYKGRYSGPAGTQSQDTATGENGLGQGVTAAHTSGWNSGTMGIAILGNYVSTPVPAAARSALVDHLAWESDHHSIDPLGASAFTNPVSGATSSNPNISGHRDWVATECPGDLFYADLPAIRQDVKAKVSGSQTGGARSYSATSVTVLTGAAAGDPVSNLSTNNGSYYRVNSGTLSGSQVTDWYATATVDPAGATGLTVGYDGSNTRSADQAVKVFNFSTGAWQQVAFASVSSTDKTFSWTTAQPAAYVSAAGEVRLRITATRSSRSFTTKADQAAFTVQY